MKKIFLYLGYVFTFGILYLIIHRRVKSYVENQNHVLIHPSKSRINIERLIAQLGGIENIKSVVAFDATVKFLLNNIQLIDVDGLKKTCHLGTIMSSDSLTILFGIESKTIASEILKIMNHETGSHS